MQWLRSVIVRWLRPEIERQLGRQKVPHAVNGPSPSAARAAQAGRTRIPHFRGC
jgi:hypothetical protein